MQPSTFFECVSFFQPQRPECQRCREHENRAERIRRTLETQLHESEQTIREQQLRITENERIIHTQGERIRAMEIQLQESQQAAQESQQRADEMEQRQQETEIRSATSDELEQSLHEAETRLATSDRVFQDVLQRLTGQIPQSQPSWVVQRNEIQLTDEELGTGSWASVKVAVFRGLHVAAKCLHHQIISAHNIRVFTREMNMASQARHPNLLQFIGATMDNEPIILTELMPTTLRRIMEEGTHLTRLQIKSLATDVARALSYLHLFTPDPIVHRDISSANVLLEVAASEVGYKAKLSDYGSANFVRYTSTAGPGNPLYAAPEANDPKRHSPKMDIYSFGILLVEMCAGELPDNHEALILTHIRDWPEMVHIIRQCLHRETQRRPDMSDVITDITHLVI